VNIASHLFLEFDCNSRRISGIEIGVVHGEFTVDHLTVGELDVDVLPIGIVGNARNGIVSEVGAQEKFKLVNLNVATEINGPFDVLSCASRP
jgi:hypothetical protein